MLNNFMPDLTYLTYAEFCEVLYIRMAAEHYHGVDPNNSLVLRFWHMYENDPLDFDFDDYIFVLNSQFESKMNAFAAQLLAESKMGVTFTIWHRFLANNKNRNSR